MRSLSRVVNVFPLGLIASLALVGCGSSDPTGSGGEGTVSFTTWGEEYIEDEIPPNSDEVTGFVDGWSVKYEKFLVNFRNIEVADESGDVAAVMPESMLFDNRVEGVKPIIDFPNIEAKAWELVGYEVAPVTEDTILSDSATSADRALMSDGGYSIYVEGTATNDDVAKHFAWGFAVGTRYLECHSEQDGKDERGIVLKNNARLEVQLTTHGDHFFYDRLQQTPDPTVETSLRFEALADADADADGEITLEELNDAPLDVRHYDPSGLKAPSHGAFLHSLARTVGHFRGEGECSIQQL